MRLCYQPFIFTAIFAAAVAAESDSVWYSQKVNANETGIFPESRVHVIRLRPGEDLLQCLYRYARELNISAASIVSTVGSLQRTNIRYAAQEDGVVLTGHFEIVSLVGNIDSQQEAEKRGRDGSGHVHISVSDESGATIGGHLLSGNVVYTTAEITLLEVIHAKFTRELDSQVGGSGYYELKVHQLE